MDLDAFSAVRGAQWERLNELTRRRRLTGAESDELVRLYQCVATDLSTVRSTAPDPATVSRLSDLLGRARTAIAGAREPGWGDVARFVVVSLPAALYRIRWWTVAVLVGSLVLAVIAGWWVATQPGALAAMGTPSERDVFTLVSNAVSVGAAGGLMAMNGRLDVFLSLIAPHGLLELTCVFVAGAAGLRIFWTWVDPGPRPRLRALAEEGRALFTVTIGLAGALAVSGAIEGFLTGSSLPWAAKVSVGALALAAFWTYTIVLGRRAVAAGQTGDLDADRAGHVLPVVG